MPTPSPRVRRPPQNHRAWRCPPRSPVTLLSSCALSTAEIEEEFSLKVSPTAAVKHIPSTADRVSSVLQRKPRIENGKFLARTLLGDPVEYAELLSAQNTKVYGAGTGSSSPVGPGRARFATQTATMSPDTVKPLALGTTSRMSTAGVHLPPGTSGDQLFEDGGLDKEDELKLALTILGDTRRKERDDRFFTPPFPSSRDSASRRQGARL
jgi:hypothetical protein